MSKLKMKYEKTELVDFDTLIEKISLRMNVVSSRDIYTYKPLKNKGKFGDKTTEGN